MTNFIFSARFGVVKKLHITKSPESGKWVQLKGPQSTEYSRGEALKQVRLRSSSAGEWDNSSVPVTLLNTTFGIDTSQN